MKKNLTKLLSLLSVFTLIFLALSCGTGSKKNVQNKSGDSEVQPPIMVFAAASLTDVLSEIIDSFEVKYQVKVQTNMASSGTLARQIEQGGTPDIFISASKKWADYIDSLGYILSGTKVAIAKNDLVLIAPLNSTLEVSVIDSSLNFVFLLGGERLSIGDPAHVPAGKYAQQSLQYFGWYDQLNGKTLPAKDVRSALMVVEMEEAPLGIVYRTDARKSVKVKILNAFPENSHKPIVYMGGVCKDNSTAKAFFDYLNSDATKVTWLKYGFKK
jgi:molybdate transport system substrate-binding protein